MSTAYQTAVAGALDRARIAFVTHRVRLTLKPNPGPTLLQRLAAGRAARRETLRLAARDRLRQALREVLPGQKVIVFGSLTRPGRFREDSDVDIAIESEPQHLNVFALMGELEERVGRPVDVIVLPACRFREEIRREGESWTS